MPLVVRSLTVLAAAVLVTLPATSSVAAQDASTSAGSPGASGGAPLVIYSGRSEELVGPLLERFTAITGIPVVVRYGESAELAALLMEEGARSPADVFFSQDAGALGAVADVGLLTALDRDVADLVDPAFRDPQDRWVGVSGRARVAARSTERLTETDMPSSIMDFIDPAWKGRLGWVPTNASFQSFVTALRILEGDEVARAWLTGILANAPVAYDSNTAAVEGIAAGEVDVAFVNHYYLLRLLEESGPDYPVANHFFAPGDPGSLVNVAGVGILGTSRRPGPATALVSFLLGEVAQTYFRDETFEYPLTGDLAPDDRLPGLVTIGSPEIDLGRLADLEATVHLLREVGALD